MAESTRQLHVTPEEIEKGKTMAVVAYFIFFIPLLMDEYKTNKFVMFHTEQATALIIFYVIAALIAGVLSPFTCGLSFVLLFVPVVFLIMGVMNALNGKVQPLPLIGQYGEKFNFVK